MEVQALAVLGIIISKKPVFVFSIPQLTIYCFQILGSHENIVGYYTSWFENERLYIQMELCDRSLSISQGQSIKSEEAFKIIYQVL